MLRTSFLENFNKNSVDYKINKYINENLRIMIGGYIERYLWDDESIDESDYMLPRYYRNQHKAKVLIEELYDIIKSDTIRIYLKPKYEYILYEILHIYLDLQDDDDFELDEMDNELKLLIQKDERFRFDPENEDSVDLTKYLRDVNSYLEECFQDYDFMEDTIDYVTNLYIHNKYFYELMIDIKLDEYVDIMAPDLREEYLKCRKDEEHNNFNLDVKQWTEEEIIRELYISLILISNQAMEFVDKGEVEISNEIYRNTKRLFKKCFNIEIGREDLNGCSSKKLGENDFYIYENNKSEYINIAIGENKVLDKFSQAYGQVIGYLNQTFLFGFTISINKNKSIDEAYKYIQNQLKKQNYKEFILQEIENNPLGEEYKYLIRSSHILPEDKSRKMNLYHFILHLNIDKRHRIAKQSRRN